VPRSSSCGSNGSAEAALDIIEERGIAGDDAFVVGATITIPLHDRSAAEAISAVRDAGIPTIATTARPPTLDDVYLHLTGDRSLPTDKRKDEP